MTRSAISSKTPEGTGSGIPRNTFSKSERLCRKSAIERLFAKGVSFHEGPLWVIFEKNFPAELSTSPLMVAFAVPKKTFRRAVKRNRIRRLMKEAFRHEKHPLLNLLNEKESHLVFLVKFNGRRIPTHTEVTTGIQRVLNRLIRAI